MSQGNWKIFFKKVFPLTGCSGADLYNISLFWKIILFSGVLFVAGFVVFFGWRKDFSFSTSSIKNASSTNLMLNREALSDVFDSYKGKEELFESDLKSLQIIVDPS
jgi:hypothetical protein